MSAACVEVRAVREPSCIRGLQYRLVYGGSLVPQRWVEQLRRASGERLVYAKESWGHCVVHRLIYQFRFEVRVMESPTSIRLLHRVCASDAQRDADREWLCEQLKAAVHEAPGYAHEVA